MPLTAGSNFSSYRIIGSLGRGGMASVHKAYEANLDRYVALKVLPAEFLHDTTFAERFQREARVIAKLEHRHIVPIHAFGVDEGIPWMAMRLVAGGTLGALLKKGHLAPRQAIEILGEAAEGLEYAHKQGVLHRDVKPQNLLLDEEGHIYLADFGIAKIVEGSTVLTKTGMISGTPQYMSPEQARGEKVDQRTDIYALGIVAYETLTGRVPFTADTPVAVLMKHIMDPIPLPAPSEVPEALIRPVLKCLAKSPDDRWPTATAFVRALELGLTEAASLTGAGADWSWDPSPDKLKAFEEEKAAARAKAVDDAKKKTEAQAAARGQTVDPAALQEAQDQARKQAQHEQEKKVQEEKRRLEDKKKLEEAARQAAMVATTTGPPPRRSPPPFVPEPW